MLPMAKATVTGSGFGGADAATPALVAASAAPTRASAVDEFMSIAGGETLCKWPVQARWARSFWGGSWPLMAQ